MPDLPAPTQWQLRADGAIEPCVPHPGGWIATEDARDVAALVEHIVIRNVLQPLAEELRAEQPIARGLLWGNVALDRIPDILHRTITQPRRRTP